MHSKNSLHAALCQALSRLPKSRAFVVALSGGTDSSVLLHALTQLRDSLPAPVRALHVNHNLQRNSAQWAENCAKLCQRWNVPYESVELAIDLRGESVEAAAREARYAAFAKALNAHETLLTAHHRGDQAETLLLRLLRGTGIHGLKGIPRYRPLGSGSVARPLLDVGKRDILSYAESSGLVANEDPSNADTAMDRNYLRHNVLPLLEARWPGYEQTLARTANLAAESAEVIDEVAGQDLEVCQLSKTTISIHRLTGLPAVRQSEVVRMLMRRLDMNPPSRAQLSALLRSVSVSGNSATLSWGSWEARAYRDTLHLLAKLPVEPVGFDQTWSARAEFDLPEGLGAWQLISTATSGHEVSPPRPLKVRFRHGGERIQLPLEPFHRKLKKLFQDAGVPPWVRNRTPMIFSDEQLWAVGNRWRSGACAAWLADHKIRLVWRNCASVEQLDE